MNDAVPYTLTVTFVGVITVTLKTADTWMVVGLFCLVAVCGVIAAVVTEVRRQEEEERRRREEEERRRREEEERRRKEEEERRRKKEEAERRRKQESCCLL